MKVAVKLLMVVAAVLPLTAATITLGNHPQQPGECNILFTNGVTGNPVTGTLNSANGCTAGQIVSFSSLTEQTLAESASGQARIETTTGGALTSMAVTVPGLTYGDLIFNLAVIGGLRATGTATVDVLSPTSTLLSSLTFDLGQGQNFVTVVAGAGEQIGTTHISTSGSGFASFQQPRISGPFATAGGGGGGGGGEVPEPATYGLFGAGIAGLTLARKLLARVS